MKEAGVSATLEGSGAGGAKEHLQSQCTCLILSGAATQAQNKLISVHLTSITTFEAQFARSTRPPLSTPWSF